MFGNSLTYNNIFGNAIQDSHQRLFGGDRMLTTKDIEGAQPKKYNRHVWGNYQANQYQNILSYDPQKSVIKSPILGDNVQPLNRAIPNSSGMIFRDPQYQSLTQKLYTQQSVKSPSQKLDLAQNTQSALTQPNERPSNNINSQSYTGLKRDSNNPLEGGSSPAVKQLSLTSQRISGRRIEPPSQLKEQNIFSHPDYVNKQLSTYAKPMVNVGNQSQNILSQSKQSLGVVQKVDQNRITDRIQNLQGYQSLQALNNVLKSNRSPDAYIPFEPTPKEYQRESISSYALGQNKDPAIEKYIQQNREKYYEQPSKSPVFQQNRNFGPDHVLSGPISVENRQSTSSYEFGSFVSPRQRQQQDVISPKQANYINENNTLPISNRMNQNDQQSHQVNQAQQDIPQIQSVPNQDNAVSQNVLQDGKNFEFNKINSQQKIYSRPQSNAQLLGRPASNNNQLTKSFTQLRNDAAASPSQDLIRLRSVLSSRARLLLNQNQNEATTNSEYGLYAAQPNRIDQPKEKILYQSKRDNFLRSHLVRSQSAEGTRLLRNAAENNYQNQDQANQIPKQQSSNSQLYKYGQWGLRNYNIIGNYMNPYKYEGRRGDPFADIKYLGKLGNNKIQSVKNLNSETKNENPLNLNQGDNQQQQELRKSGYPSSPLAGVQNQYDETNKKFNALYHSQRTHDQHSVKYYGAKALKNLSNIKLY
ncbi:hypothetical protein ABPG74_002400 [Tetrahymena malaccensis]